MFLCGSRVARVGQDELVGEPLGEGAEAAGGRAERLELVRSENAGRDSMPFPSHVFSCQAA